MRLLILTVFIAFLGSAFELQHNPNRFSFYTDRGFHRVRAPDFYPSGNPGAPELPVRYLHYIIPPNMEAVGIRIISSSMVQISGSYYIFPAQRPVPLCSIPSWTPPDSTIYNSDSLYPNNPIEIIRNGVFDGARLVTVAVYPLRYRPKTRRVFLVRQVSFEFQFRTTNPPDRAHVRGINSQRVYDAILSTAVENDFEIPLYYHQPNLIPEEPPSKLQPTTYTIITNDAIPGMMEEFQYFADWLTEKGIPAVVYPLSLALRHPGVDDAERLRNFIIDAYKQCGTIWVLLGGDADIVPYRQGWGENFNPPYPQPSDSDAVKPPSDLYFSDLNGDWDSDEDGHLGEPHDQVDLYPEVFVGRVLVRNLQEVRNWVEKILYYEKKGSAYLPFFQYAGWIYDSSFYPWPWQTFPSYFIHRFYENVGANIAVDALSAGYGWYGNYMHGSSHVFNPRGDPVWWKVWAYWPGARTQENDGLNNLTNTDRYYVVYSFSCYNAAYDSFINPFPQYPLWDPTDTTIADAFTDFYEKKGAVAFLGNTRYGWDDLSQRLHNAFCKLLFGDQGAPYSLGVLEGWSKVNYPHRYLRHAHNLFGSPENEPWINTPGRMVVEHPTWIPAGQPVRFPVTVFDEKKNALDFVRVCLYKPGDIYKIGYTDEGGRVTFDIYTSTSGVLKVTCFRPRQKFQTYTQYLPYEGFCLVGTKEGGGQAQVENLPKELFVKISPSISFGDNLKILYGLPRKGRIRIALYDPSGREVSALKDEVIEEGFYSEVFNLREKPLANEIYLLVFKTEAETRTKKLVFRK